MNNKDSKAQEGSPKLRRVRPVPENMKGFSMSWTTLETSYRKKSRDWYFLLWTIALAGAAIATILDNLLFGILLVISAFVLSIYAAQRPKEVKVTVSRKGIRVGDVAFPFSSLSLFAIAEEQIPTYLLLQSKKPLSPLHTIPITEEVDIDTLREFLLMFIDEGDMETPIYQQLMDRIGF